jgi:hypothetical protein
MFLQICFCEERAGAVGTLIECVVVMFLRHAFFLLSVCLDIFFCRLTQIHAIPRQFLLCG